MPEWLARQSPVLAAGLIVLFVGFIDDTRGVSPRLKLIGQGVAVVVLYLGGVRIQSIDLLGLGLDLSRPSIVVALPFYQSPLSVPGFLVTLVWFLGCMNVWNLIDGMDGLASGVGLMAAGTLTLVAIKLENVGVAITASALAGALAGFLLYNWHPACIFLGDSGSLLIGLLIGVIGVQGSFKGPSAISILFPILAMGLPISDTALAIFRRWVRNLPMSAADRRHVHHLLIGLGLNPRQAALLLYCFSGFLCGAVLLGVALRNEQLALLLGVAGCSAFLLILTSRLNELASLRGDLRARMARGRQERLAAKIAWEAIQRIELAHSVEDVCTLLDGAGRELGCHSLTITCIRDGLPVFGNPEMKLLSATFGPPVSGPTAVFRLPLGDDLMLSVVSQQSDGSPLAADIAFRFVQRLALATAERLEWLLAFPADGGDADKSVEAEGVAALERGEAGGPGGARPGRRVGGNARAGVGEPYPVVWDARAGLADLVPPHLRPPAPRRGRCVFGRRLTPCTRPGLCPGQEPNDP